MLDVSRRDLFTGAAALAGTPAIVAQLPDRTNFRLDHTYLNAAYTHPMGAMTYRATEAFLQARVHAVDTPWPADNARDRAVALFAALINADPADIAVVPSTMEGENMVVRALGLGPGRGAVTDAFHYSPQIYGELRRRGAPVRVAMPRDNRIDPANLDALIKDDTRLVSVSAVASDTGFRHDLDAVCRVAHAKGAMVYADIIQAAGAAPLDVKATPIDFACCGAYKWLMGDFGVAFLYVRPDRLHDLSRVFAGWRQLKSYQSRLYPFDPGGPPGIDYELRTDTVGLFEVSTPSWAALAGLTASLAYLQQVGVEAIAAHRRPLMTRLQAEAPRLGLLPLTPTAPDTPAIAFAYPDALRRLGPPLQAARIKVQLSRSRLRISPSVYNDMNDIERLLQVLKAAA